MSLSNAAGPGLRRTTFAVPPPGLIGRKICRDFAGVEVMDPPFDRLAAAKAIDLGQREAAGPAVAPHPVCHLRIDDTQVAGGEDLLQIDVDPVEMVIDRRMGLLGGFEPVMGAA